ncbi:MAG: hypothetical protein HYY65_06970 [Candidatus Tectomicrobia bacterium]|uniref:Uncharacterized protein n=1 Tax=Tectimicrobiota bacterium TaxID=2528274 RepID=A0A932GP86_UNCTE|nr:hypothetical protein [Candidatus Tectomicrobia bacterium]
MIDYLSQAASNSLRLFGEKLALFLPNLLVALMIAVVGFLVALLIRYLMIRLLRAGKIDQASQRLGFSDSLLGGAIGEAPSLFLSRLVYWTVLIIFLVAALEALGMKATDRLTSGFFAFLPDLLVAVVILFIGFLLGNFIGRATLIAAVNANLRHSRWIAQGVRVTILAFTVAMALEQLGLARNLIVVAFAITFGGVILALALAFGLGAQDKARAFLEEHFGRGETPHGEKKSGISHL